MAACDNGAYNGGAFAGIVMSDTDEEFKLNYSQGDLIQLCEMLGGRSSIKRPVASMATSLKQIHHLSDRDLTTQMAQYIESLEDTCESSCESSYLLNSNLNYFSSLASRLCWSCS